MSYCMIDYVGLDRSCGFTPSASGMYLSQLPGMDAEWFDAIADGEQVTAQGLWNDVQEMAAATFREDIISEFGKRYMVKQVTQSVDLGKQIDTTSTTPPILKYYGLLIQTELPDSQCACSNLQKIFIQSLSFYYSGANPNPSITLTFKDADLLTTEYTLTQNAVAGWNTIWLDREFNASRLYVFVSGNMDNYVKLDLSQFFLQNFGPVNVGWSQWGAWGSFLSFGFGGCGCQAMVQGVSYDDVANVANTDSNAFGVSVVLSTRCSFDQIVCNNKQHFASLWQHCLAIELLNYRINSSRLNKWTTITKDQAISLQTLFTQKYRGGVQEKTMLEYPGKLQSSVTSISLNDSDCCLRNNDRYIWREVRV